MKKKIKSVSIILLIVSILFLTISVSFAETSGTGGIGDGGSSSATGSGSWNSTVFGFRIAAYNSSNSQKGSVQTYYKSSISELSTWIERDSDGSWTTTPTVLYDYLDIPYAGVSNNYSNLKSLITAAGITLSSGDYVLIEPFTEIGGVLLSFRGISNSTATVTYDGKNYSFSEWYKRPATILADAAKVGNDITVGGKTYTAPSSLCTVSNYSSSKCGYSSNSYLGYGITVVKYEDMYPKGSIEITKKNSVTKTTISGVEFYLYSGSDCEGNNYITKGTTNSSGKITFSDLTPGSYSIYENTIPSGYSTPSTRCTNITVTSDNTTKKDIENSPKGSLTIKKKNNLGVDVTGAEFTVYSGANCTGSIETKLTSSGNVSFTLDAGTYYVEETKVSNSNYYEGVTGGCKQINISAGADTPISWEDNKLSCQYYLDTIVGADKKATTIEEKRNLIKLYNGQYVTGQGTYSTYRGLLNFDNPKCSPEKVTKSYETSCLGVKTSSSSSSSFNENNISMFTEKHGNYTFCLTTFDLENDLGKSNFGTVNSGQAIIKKSGVIAIATLKRTCYNYGDETEELKELNYTDYVSSHPTLNEVTLSQSSKTRISNKNNKTITVEKLDKNDVLIEKGASFNLYEGYDCSAAGNIYNNSSAYVGKLNESGILNFSNLPDGQYSVYEKETFNGITMPGTSGLIMSDGSRTTSNRCTNIDVNSSSSSVNKDIRIIKVGYLLPKVYASNGEGILSYHTKPNKQYKYIGRAIMSQFNFKGPKSLDFNIGLTGFGGETSSSECSYYSEQEVITATTKKNSTTIYKKLGDIYSYELAFRTIDINNPFPGKNGIARRTGLNWSIFSLDANNDNTIDSKDIDNLDKYLNSGSGGLQIGDLSEQPSYGDDIFENSADWEDIWNTEEETEITDLDLRYDMNGDKRVTTSDIETVKRLMNDYINSGSDTYGKTILNNSNSSLGIDKTTNKKVTAKYRIELKPSDIEAIRKYNKQKTYDDYTLTCNSNGNKCTSNFLKKLKEGSL